MVALPKYLLEKHEIWSAQLKRNVTFEVILPHDYYQHSQIATRYPFLVLNDGQDSRALKLRKIIERLAFEHRIRPFIAISIFCSHERVQEYGVISTPDYKGRGAKAPAYNSFVINELISLLRAKYRFEEGNNAIAGYSLGGLSAIDIGLHNDHIFSKIGVFSGAFWWRSRDWTLEDPDGGRIMHDEVKKETKKKNLKFWFQTGTHDEKDDRNNNGVIDSIDDTLDLICELAKVGYRPFHDISYLEVVGGVHHPITWAAAMPEFLKWAFPLRSQGT